jgi:tetratricopeptide (TPR) repeat protein
LLKSGQLDEAEAHWHEILGIAQGLSYTEGLAAYTGGLARLALAREQWPDAERLARDALALAETLGRREFIADYSRLLAQALARQGRGIEGLPHAERAVAIFTKLHSHLLPEAQTTLNECRGQPD